MKAGARRHVDPTDAKMTNPPHRQDDSANEPVPTRQSAQSRSSAVANTSRVPSQTLEPVYPLEKVNLTKKARFYEEYFNQNQRGLWFSYCSIGGGCDPAPLSTMIAISWNCQGLENRRAVQVLADLVRKKRIQDFVSHGNKVKCK